MTEHGQPRAPLMQLLKYAAVGGTATIVDIALFAACVYFFNTHYLLAGLLSFSCGTILNYFLCIRFLYTSGARFQRNMEVGAIFAVGAFGIVLHQTSMFGLVEWLELEVMLSKVVTTGVVFLWNFCAREYFVFSAKTEITRD